MKQPDCTYQGVWKKGFKRKVKENSRKFQGKLTWKNGDVYIGRLKKDKFNGPGVLTCGNGDKYDGSWKFGRVKKIQVESCRDTEKACG